MIDWHKRAEELHIKHGNHWEALTDELQDDLGIDIKSEKVRRWFRSNKPKLIRQGQKDEKINIVELLELLKKPCTIDTLIKKSGLDKSTVQEKLTDYTKDGYQIENDNGLYKLSKFVLPQTITHKIDWKGSKVLKFGVVSDPHMCSNDQQLTHFNNFYDILADEGIDTCYNVGDISEGVNMRQGHEYEVFAHGVDQQAKYIIENYPKRTGLKTYYVTGNHDHSGIKSAGVDIGRIIANERDDMIYLGKQSARVMLTPNCSMDLVHPLDGAAYSLSYSTQKYIDSLSGGDKPNLLMIGHHHKAFMLPVYRNICSFECGTFQRQTKWMQGKRLAAHVGGWIIEILVDEKGTVRRCKGEFISYFNFIEHDYRL